MSEAARLNNVDGFSVHLARIAPGGLLGRHLTRLWQWFAVMSRTGWVAGSDGVHYGIQSGQAVMRSPGEEHESGSDGGNVSGHHSVDGAFPRGGGVA